MARRRSTNSPAGPGKPGKLLNEIGGLLLFGLGVVVLLALVSYDAGDPSWNATGSQLKAHNWIGPVGALLSDGLYQAFGYLALLVPFLLFALAWWRLLYPRPPLAGVKVLGLGLLLGGLIGLLALAESCASVASFHSGGWVGHLLTCDEAYGLRRFFNTTGSAIILSLLLVSGLILATPFSLVGMIVHLTPREREAGIVHALAERFRAWRQMREAERELRALEREKERQERLRRLQAPEDAPRVNAPEERPVVRARSGEETKTARSEEAKKEEAKREEKRDERKARLTTLGLTEALHEVLPPRGRGASRGENGREEDEEDSTVTIVKPEPKIVATTAATEEPVKDPIRDPVRDPIRDPAKEPLKEALKERIKEAAKEAAKDAVGVPLGKTASDVSAVASETSQSVGEARAQSTSASASPPAPPAAAGWRSRLSDWRHRGRPPVAPPPADPGGTESDEMGEDFTAEPEAAIAPAPDPAARPHSHPASHTSGSTAGLAGSSTPAPPEGRMRYSDLAARGERTGERTVEEMLATASVHRPPADDTRMGPRSARQKSLVRTVSEFKYPTTEMLTPPEARSEMADTELMERAQQLAEKCREFNVAGVVKQISPGPVVTTFEFKLDPGVKYGRVTSLVDDLCLGLKAESIRIDRIPGKSTVGIEVPNQRREIIRLREVLEAQRFRESPSKLTIALGKTIDGSNYIADLAKMPHLLIAGATGAGKSVALNTILASLIYKATPEEVKLILIDPKRLELGLYADIPHLLTPIVTDPKRASYALKWAVSEMENRYKHLASFGVRNIDQYNQEVCAMVDRSLAEESDDLPRPLPYIVIIIDELADLMMVSARDVEESITRLAQMARAVGIHLVLATQRPSTDVITGLIKANFPSRISFRVSSKVDSRVIIDTNGAEGLLGQGDMLFLPPGSSRLIRVHGAFVDEKEVKRIADHVRAQRRPVYDERIQMSEKELEGEQLAEMRRDEKYEEALRIVFEMGRASTSVLQRRLRIGYGRAASIIDMMHREGIVGPEDGSKPRQVLVSEQDRVDFLERLAQLRQDEE